MGSSIHDKDVDISEMVDSKTYEEKLYEDIWCVWNRYLKSNVSFKPIRYELLKKPKNGCLDKRIQNSFNRQKAKPNNVVISNTLFDDPLGNVLEITEKLVPANIEAWYRTPEREKVSEKLFSLSKREYEEKVKSWVHLAKGDYSLLLDNEVRIFSKSVEFYLEKDITTFGHLAYPAVENLLRIFVLIASSKSFEEDGLILDFVIRKDDYPIGDFFLLNDLLKHAESIKESQNKEEISECVRFLRFFLTGSKSGPTMPAGLNLRNDLAHGLIRRDLRPHEGLAFILAWLLGFKLIHLCLLAIDED